LVYKLRNFFYSNFCFFPPGGAEAFFKFFFLGGGGCSVLTIHYIEFCLSTQAIIISSVLGMLCSLVHGIRGFVL